ncbi:enoyl-CoA hydratase/isomerase family protein [Paeniglutamicibacter cryotolerans]|uniref:3-hydroxyisobutyryl-CoA hydrolase n=1 Tax=Paeniglutamicibacter cryotolerans TaxID=670079 RepID=A0A839QIB4_9MICC|nr:enoyl-CoA hydratase/isomerase family protein [Paeniglutamicibacter cryotolerans]MBB2994484.1 enoyl-CoA hydratase [Paeniglutamicibacter cryotolerans]
MSHHVSSTVADGLGIITLDRPSKINALTGGMLRELARTLTTWADNPAVKTVLLLGNGERGFCAGGDIKDFHTAIVSGNHSDFTGILAGEFAMNLIIATYPKPVASMMHGLTMGGGVGLGSHAGIRIVAPNSKLAMPEVKIGYSPDVGGTHLLGNAPGRLGEYLAMTGTTMDAADAIHAGFADFMVAAEDFDDVLATLPDLAGLPALETSMALEILLGKPARSDLAARQPWIDDMFSAPTSATILERLDAAGHAGAREAAEMIRANSPLGVETALQAVRAARSENHLRSALERELRIAAFLMHEPDLAEGIRAQVIDKDRNPAWNPASATELDLERIAAVIADPA